MSFSTNNNIAAATDAVNESQHYHRKHESQEDRVREEQAIRDTIESAAKKKTQKAQAKTVLFGKAPTLIPPKEFGMKSRLAQASLVSENGGGSNAEELDTTIPLSQQLGVENDEMPSLQRALLATLKDPCMNDKNQKVDTDKVQENSCLTLKQDSDDDLIPHNGNLIATLCYIMSLEVKVNSDYWANNFNLASQDMNMIADMGPAAANAAKATYDAQADEARNQAAMQYSMGWAQASMAGISLAAGAAGGYKAAFGKEASNISTAEAKQVLGEAKFNAISEAAGGGKAGEEAAASAAAAAKAGRGFMEGNLWKFISETFKTASERYMYFGGVSQAASSFVQAHYEGLIAGNKTDQGNATALEKTFEYYIQYKQSDFQRMSELTNQAQEFINSFISTTQSEVQEISQTARAMFQG